MDYFEVLSECLSDYEVLDVSDHDLGCGGNKLFVEYDPGMDEGDYWAFVTWIEGCECLKLVHCHFDLLPLDIVLHEAAHVLDGSRRWFAPHSFTWRKLYLELLDKYSITN